MRITILFIFLAFSLSAFSHGTIDPSENLIRYDDEYSLDEIFDIYPGSTPYTEKLSEFYHRPYQNIARSSENLIGRISFSGDLTKVSNDGADLVLTYKSSSFSSCSLNIFINILSGKNFYEIDFRPFSKVKNFGSYFSQNDLPELFDRSAHSLKMSDSHLEDPFFRVVNYDNSEGLLGAPVSILTCNLQRPIRNNFGPLLSRFRQHGIRFYPPVEQAHLGKSKRN